MAVVALSKVAEERSLLDPRNSLVPLPQVRRGRVIDALNSEIAQDTLHRTRGVQNNMGDWIRKSGLSEFHTLSACQDPIGKLGMNRDQGHWTRRSRSHPLPSSRTLTMD
jgi:hypothetical protein